MRFVRHTMAYLLIASAFLWAGCYLSHPVVGEGGVNEDAGIDSFSVDASTETTACALALLDRTEVLWAPVDCGLPRHPQVTFDGSQFQLVITEDRFCDDRPGGIFHRAVSLDGARLALEDVATTLGARDRGFAYAASAPSGWAVCSGNRLFRSRVAGWSAARPAGPPSPEITLCRGLAHHGDGWTVARDVVDEDVFLHQLLRLSGGAARETSYRTAGNLAVASGLDGIMALSYPRSEPPSYLWWSSDSRVPEEHPVARLEQDIRATAVAPWPFAENATALFFASSDAVRMRVVDRRARVLIEHTYAVGREGYEPDALSVAETNRGMVVAVGYRREGRQLGYFRSLISLDETGALAQEMREERPRAMHPDGPWGGPASVTVAAQGDKVLVHQLHGESEETDRTEVLLLGCQ